EPLTRHEGEQAQREREILQHVAPEQSRRLLGHAMHPLQPQFLQPPRGALDLATDEAEAHAHAQEPRPRERRAQNFYEPLLLGETEADENDVRLDGRQRIVDLAHLLRINDALAAVKPDIVRSEEHTSE